MGSIDWARFFQVIGRSIYQNSIRYLVTAGGLFLLFYVWKRRAWFYRKIQLRLPQPAKIRHEVLWSISSILVFGLISASIGAVGLREHMKLYPDIAARGWTYFGLSVLGLILWHDCYFYWTHRLLHTRWMFRHVHRIHHHSHDPTPWAAFSFHPIEAAVQVGFIYIAPLLVPLNRSAILIAVLYQMALNTLGHLGFELLPTGFATGRWTRWFNTSTHHNMHHSRVQYNYGLYFNIWDRLMGTNHPEYEATFDSVKARGPLSEDELEARGLVRGRPAPELAEPMPAGR